MALVARKPQAHERFSDAALLALLPHVAAGFRAAVQQHPRPARGVVDVTWPGAGGGGGRALALPDGDEQQIAPAGLVPENALAVAGGGSSYLHEQTARQDITAFS